MVCKKRITNRTNTIIKTIIMNTTEIKIGKSEIVNIDKLNPSDINRAIDENHVRRFTHKLNQFGWLDAIKVDNQYNILEGHHRYYAAKKMGLEEVPVYKVWWYDNLTEMERLAVILQYNASNLKWTNEDYLEKYSLLDQSYAKAFVKYNKYKGNLSTGTILNLYLTGSIKAFRNGESIYRSGEMSDMLAANLSTLVDKYTKKKAQAYCLREIVKVCQASKSILAAKYILKRYEDMLDNNHAKLTSISDFRPHINDVLSEYLVVSND